LMKKPPSPNSATDDCKRPSAQVASCPHSLSMSPILFLGPSCSLPSDKQSRSVPPHLLLRACSSNTSPPALSRFSTLLDPHPSVIQLSSLIQGLSLAVATPLLARERSQFLDRTVRAIATVKVHNAAPFEQCVFASSLDRLYATVLRLSTLWGTSAALAQFATHVRPGFLVWGLSPPQPHPLSTGESLQETSWRYSGLASSPLAAFKCASAN
jgi:hypothetical protein